MNVWLVTTEVAERARRHPDTVRRAAEEGELHGHQRKRRGRWQFTQAAVDAWIRGENSQTACGCSRLKAARRTA